MYRRTNQLEDDQYALIAKMLVIYTFSYFYVKLQSLPAYHTIVLYPHIYDVCGFDSDG